MCSHFLHLVHNTSYATGSSHIFNIIANYFQLFSNIISPEVISGNITANISDHLLQFLFAPNILSGPSCHKEIINENDWSKFMQQNFIRSYFDKEWSDVLQFEQENANLSKESFLNNIEIV